MNELAFNIHNNFVLWRIEQLPQNKTNNLHLTLHAYKQDNKNVNFIQLIAIKNEIVYTFQIFITAVSCTHKLISIWVQQRTSM